MFKANLSTHWRHLGMEPATGLATDLSVIDLREDSHAYERSDLSKNETQISTNLAHERALDWKENSLLQSPRLKWRSRAVERR